jgi:HAD superfamily hydrolase (TIGR01509 family)
VLVIFDNDGVLVDTERISNGVLAEMLTAIGLPCTEAECMRDYMGRSWDGTKAIIERRLGRELDDSFREERRVRMRERAEAELSAIPSIDEAIAQLNGEPRCVASSSSHLWIHFALSLTGLIGHFPEGTRFSAEDVGRGKPHPDLFLHAAATMGFDPRECVVVEDSPVGVEAARAAGMRVIGYAGHTAREELHAADAVIVDMADLPAVLTT